MVFEETFIFTRRVTELLSDDMYAALQNHLVLHPDAGDVIPGSGGLRKVRWSAPGRGKRGGVRFIYYWWHAKDIISLLLIYAKNEQDDPTPDQLKKLKQLLN
ncbi:MAG TPA: hypothetical protein VGE39_13695 [Prosthecobacter sp.]